MRGAWDDMVAREGNAPVVLAGDDACPACGTAAPLVRGACSDCGLQLE
jgi:predicted amidophosphoribosyltransferase